jgi:hypothetical protein
VRKILVAVTGCVSLADHDDLTTSPMMSKAGARDISDDVRLKKIWVNITSHAPSARMFTRYVDLFSKLVEHI